jgi:hypothetical protein
MRSPLPVRTSHHAPNRAIDGPSRSQCDATNQVTMHTHRPQRTIPAAGSDEGFQAFLAGFGPAAATYTDAELRQFYRDMLLLAELLVDLYLEKHRYMDTNFVDRKPSQWQDS